MSNSNLSIRELDNFLKKRPVDLAFRPTPKDAQLYLEGFWCCQLCCPEPFFSVSFQGLEYMHCVVDIMPNEARLASFSDEVASQPQWLAAKEAGVSGMAFELWDNEKPRYRCMVVAENIKLSRGGGWDLEED